MLVDLKYLKERGGGMRHPNFTWLVTNVLQNLNFQMHILERPRLLQMIRKRIYSEIMSLNTTDVLVNNSIESTMGHWVVPLQ